jgi:hypothetical protein
MPELTCTYGKTLPNGILDVHVLLRQDKAIQGKRRIDNDKARRQDKKGQEEKTRQEETMTITK